LLRDTALLPEELERDLLLVLGRERLRFGVL
jgi:hypothetical protein